MTENIDVSRPKKNTRRTVAFLASLAMLGIELPYEKKSEKLDLPTRGVKGLSNSELRTCGKKRKRKRR